MLTLILPGILDTQYRDIFDTETLFYWVKNTLTINSEVLEHRHSGQGAVTTLQGVSSGTRPALEEGHVWLFKGEQRTLTTPLSWDAYAPWCRA